MSILSCFGVVIKSCCFQHAEKTHKQTIFEEISMPLHKLLFIRAFKIVFCMKLQCLLIWHMYLLIITFLCLTTLHIGSHIPLCPNSYTIHDTFFLIHTDCEFYICWSYAIISLLQCTCNTHSFVEVFCRYACCSYDLPMCLNRISLKFMDNAVVLWQTTCEVRRIQSYVCLAEQVKHLVYVFASL